MLPVTALPVCSLDLCNPLFIHKNLSLSTHLVASMIHLLIHPPLTLHCLAFFISLISSFKPSAWSPRGISCVRGFQLGPWPLFRPKRPGFIVVVPISSFCPHSAGAKKVPNSRKRVSKDIIYSFYSKSFWHKGK